MKDRRGPATVTGRIQCSYVTGAPSAHWEDVLEDPEARRPASDLKAEQTLEEGKALMKYARRCVIAAIAATLAMSGAAAAAPVTVDLRVEGATQTIYEGPVTTDGKSIDGHPCDGTNLGANPNPGPTMTSALDDASASGAFTWDRTWFAGFEDFGVDRIGPDATDLVNFHFWGYALNLTATSIGGCQQQVGSGDDVLFGFDFFSKAHLLKLEGPGVALVGGQIAVKVTDGQDGSAVSGASVGGVNTGADGTATLSLNQSGTFRLKATRADSLRSNALDVCVHVEGDGLCNLPAKVAARDSSAPIGRISGLRNGGKYRRGRRLLRGTVADNGSGVANVKLSLRRHRRGKCSWWSRTSERFSGKDCRRKVFFSIGDKANWSYQLAQSLRPARYVLDVKARDRAGNVDSTPVRGRNRVVFRVKNGRRAGARRSVRSSGRGARVDVMVVGKGERIISSPRRVTARSVTVRASGKRCKVAASTPLAALVARTKRSLALGIKDFGSCSRRRARDSSQLFVRSIGSQRNKRDDGWVYSKDFVVPPVGAADPSGRLDRFDQLRWFYCSHDSKGRCQSALSISPSATQASAGGTFGATVSAFDDRGRGTLVAGATLTVGDSSAVTTPAGLAFLALPLQPGRYKIRATAPGTLPAFPKRLQVEP